MLVNPTYKTGDIISIKTTSGEELIGRFVEESMLDFKLAKPVCLVPTPNGSLGMVPAMFSVELNTANITLQKTAVAFHAHTRKDIADEYIKGTTGIKPASSLVGIDNASSSKNG